MKKARISVIIPFYNPPLELFKQCLEHIKNIKPYEVILVDDCSTCKEAIQVAKNFKFKYLKTPYQSGRDALPLSIGVEHAKGDYICKVDSDDFLIELPKEMKNEICFASHKNIMSAHNVTIEQFILGPRALANGLVAKKEIFAKYMWIQDTNIYADLLFVLQLLHNKYSFSIYPRINYIYNSREGSVLTSDSFLSVRLRNIQTVARFCEIEKIDPSNSLKYLRLAMLNFEYGSQALKFLEVR